MTLVLSDADIRALADMDRCIDAIERVCIEEHSGSIVMPPRLNLSLDGTFLRVMPVQLGSSGILGYKTFHGSMDRGVRYLVVLCRASDGEIMALMDASYLTALRTGATSGVATRYLATPGLVSVAVIGSGLEAETNLAGVAAVRDVRSVRVFSRSAVRRETFAERVREFLHTDVEAVDTAPAAVEGVDVVVVATNSGTNGLIAYEGRWIRPGQHIVAIGATSPFLRELDEAAFDRPDRVVFDVALEQMLEDCGDVIALSEPVRAKLRSAISLADLVAAGTSERSDGEVTLFKSVGTAAQDLAAAKVLFDAAIDVGVGTEIGQLAAAKMF